jgi:hypothetical protein
MCSLPFFAALLLNVPGYAQIKLIRELETKDVSGMMRSGNV